ncbi:hypothetical protein OQA88_4397 [Cercophora sp. LCS_1]
MKNIIPAIVFVLAGLADLAATLSHHGRDDTRGPYNISEFSASKGHNSGYCRYGFNVSAPSLDAPTHCGAYVDAGFSGATWLAFVYDGVGNCTNTAVTWTFFHPTNGGDATFNVTVHGLKGRYIVPQKDITVSLNDEDNPFDNDVAYTGPKDFKVSDFDL